MSLFSRSNISASPRKFPAPLCLLFLLCSCLTLLWGCEQQKSRTSTAQTADAQFQTYRIGLVPEVNLFAQKKRYQPLLDYLSRHLGATLEGVVLPHYGNVIEDFSKLNLDGAFFGSLTGALAINSLQVEPLARPQYTNGESSYYGMVFARRSSRIRSAQDMQNKRMVFVHGATTAGYLLPLFFFEEIGIDNYRDWFDETYFSGTHEDAIYDVLNGLADVGAAKSTVFYRLADSDKRLIEELEILTTSPHVPENALAMLKDIPEDLKQGLMEKLLTMHLNAEGREILAELKIERFINTTAADYQTVFDYAKRIGFDLSSYEIQTN